MEGRRRGPPQPPRHAFMDDPRHPLHHRAHQASLMEDRLESQHRDIQTLLIDNQRLGATHVALKQEVAAVQQDFRHMSASASKIKAERDAQIREIYERSLKLEAEVRSINELNSELIQVREDVKMLEAKKMEMMPQLEAVRSDLERVRSGFGKESIIKAEIDTMHKEVQRGRAAIEYEKKTHADNLEHGQSMEKNMAVMAREIEKLRAELANAEKRARAAAAVAAAANPGPGYSGAYGSTGSYGNTEMGYGGNLYADPYSMSQGYGGGSQYGLGAYSHGPYDMQQRGHPQR